MSRRTRRTASSMSSPLSRWFRKFLSARPSSFVITSIIIAYAIFLFGGGIYTIITSPLPSVYIGQSFIFIYPDLGSQFVSDTIIAVALYAIGFSGIFAIYQSTKYAYKPRQAYMTLVVGVALLLLAYIFLEDAIFIKLRR